MQIKVEKLTGEKELNWAFNMTSRHQVKDISLADAYKWGHSPQRTQIFLVEMLDIPSFVSTHFVRHKIGVEHYVQTNRDDRGGTKEATRMTPVNHGMLLNAEALVNMAHKRMCGKSHPETRIVMECIRIKVKKVDPDLARHLVSECVYRGGVCHEPKPCGHNDYNMRVIRYEI